MNKVSVIIPHYPINGEVDELLKKCVDSLVGYTELLVIVNDGMGFGKAVNVGLRLAKGDYLAVVSNDVYLESGSLQDLAQENTVVSATWGLANGPAIGIDFHPGVFMIPRKVYEKIGGFDETFEIADYEDCDFYERCKYAGIAFKHNPSVRFYGKQGFTKRQMKQFPSASENNRKRFIEKWGKEPEVQKEINYQT